MMANIVRTKIYNEEAKDFSAYLIATGFKDFVLIPHPKDLYLDLELPTPQSVFNYLLRGIESAYKSTRAKTYFYDLDPDWDDEADKFFGGPDDS